MHDINSITFYDDHSPLDSVPGPRHFPLRGRMQFSTISSHQLSKEILTSQIPTALPSCRASEIRTVCLFWWPGHHERKPGFARWYRFICIFFMLERHSQKVESRRQQVGRRRLVSESLFACFSSLVRSFLRFFLSAKRAAVEWLKAHSWTEFCPTASRTPFQSI